MLVNSFRVVPIIKQPHHYSISTLLQEVVLSNSVTKNFVQKRTKKVPSGKAAFTIYASMGFWGRDFWLEGS